jgi:chaperonin GroES
MVKEKPVEGEVLAVGTGLRDENGRFIPMETKVGDRVLFGKWAGTDVVIEGEELLILKQSGILGLIEDRSRARAKAA